MKKILCVMFVAATIFSPAKAKQIKLFDNSKSQIKDNDLQEFCELSKKALGLNIKIYNHHQAEISSAQLKRLKQFGILKGKSRIQMKVNLALASINFLVNARKNLNC